MTEPLIIDGPGQLPAASSEAYRALIERFYALSRGGTKFGLGRISRVLADLGHPELAFESVHIAGSNGKGSTSAFLAAILSAAGKKAGLFTSPHLISLTERIQFVEATRPRAITQSELLAAVARLEAVAPQMADLSFFEAVTAAGLIAFRTAEVDVAVVEAGLGARLDATRLVDAKVAVLTDLSLEHTAILGDTIEEIAAEEGAVVRPDRPLVMADGPPEAMTVVDRMAAGVNASVFRIGREMALTPRGDRRFDLRLQDRSLSEVEVSLSGAHQGRNALLAAQAATLLDPNFDEDTIRRGLAQAQWPGRMEVIEDVLLDGAHNPHAAEALAAALRSDPRFAGRPLHLLFGVLRDKDARRMLETLLGVATSMIVTRPASLRSRTPAEVVELARSLGSKVPEVIEPLPDALVEARRRAARDEGWVVLCGSLYLVGDARSILLRGRSTGS